MIISDFSSSLRDSSEHLSVPEPLGSYFWHLECNCVHACCGLAAFDFRTEHTTTWAQGSGMEAVRITLLQLRELKLLIAQTDFRKVTENYPLNEFQEDELCSLLNAAEANLIAEIESYRALPEVPSA